MQRQKQQSKINSMESPRYPTMKSTIKQLIQQDIQKTAQNLKQTNFVIKYPVNQLKQSQSFNTNQCNCNENEYDEINSFSEEDEIYSEYDHLNMSNDNHYLQPANQTNRKSVEESNYYHLYRKNSNASQDSIPPPLPKSKLPEIKPYSIMTTSNELLNKSFASDKFDSFLSPISSGYNSCQDISNNNSTNNKKYNSEYYSYYSQQCLDSGFSTLNISNRVSEDEDISSNLSPYYSSPSNSSVSSYNHDLEPMVQASPFPRVNTSFVAQIKQIKSNKKVVSTHYKQEEPIYENLKPVKCNKATKQYSLNDIFNHLNSLDLNEPTRPRYSHFSPINQRIDYNDVLCDKEVEFYLSPTKKLNDLHSYTNSAPIKVNHFWEQLV